MLRLRKFKDNDQGIGIMAMLLIFGGAMIVGLMFIAWLMMDMIIKNILPIGIVIILAMVLPIIVKGWYFGKTGEKYSSKGA